MTIKLSHILSALSGRGSNQFPIHSYRLKTFPVYVNLKFCILTFLHLPKDLIRILQFLLHLPTCHCSFVCASYSCNIFLSVLNWENSWWLIKLQHQWIINENGTACTHAVCEVGGRQWRPYYFTVSVLPVVAKCYWAVWATYSNRTTTFYRLVIFTPRK